MNLNYVFREMFAGIRQARVSFLISVFTVSFLLILVGFFTMVSANLQYFRKIVHERMQLQAFISNTMTDDQIAGLNNIISRIESVDRVVYISKEVAAKAFQEEFGKEIFNLIGENPLPSSFTITLKENYRNEKDLQQIAEYLQNEPGIDEVVYQNQAVLTLSKYAEIAANINLLLLIFLTLGSLLVISNNIRFVILSRRHIIQTMQLVGATAGFIRLPLLLEGALQGLLAGLFASLFLCGLDLLIETQLPTLVGVAKGDNFILIVVGIGFGLLGGFWAIRRYL